VRLIAFGISASGDSIPSPGSYLRGKTPVMYHTTSHNGSSLFSQITQDYSIECELQDPPRRLDTILINVHSALFE
jgi:hypothetical protein